MLLASSMLLLWIMSSAALPRHGAACSIIFDGRMPPSVQSADFDSSSSVFDHEFVHGENQTWSDIIRFPPAPPSIFDKTVGAKPLEVTISDESIFVLGGGPPQTGFRRSELLPALNNGTDITVKGTTTIHWSLRLDPARPFNWSHEHQIVWHERSDFSTDQFMLKTGTPFGETVSEAEAKTLRLEGTQTTQELIFKTVFEENVWHNFAVTVGWESNDFAVYYSKGFELLTLRNATTNDNSLGGQQHWGILRLPTGDAGIDVVHDRFQGTGLNEGLIYGGIFIEDSSDDCVTLHH